MAAPAFTVGRNMDHPHLKGKFTLRVWIPVEQVQYSTVQCSGEHKVTTAEGRSSLEALWHL